jgi:hypothetical protein
MPDVDSFREEVARDLRRRIALLGDSGDRRALEDGVALLTDARLDGMDEARFEGLLLTLGAGRSPSGLPVLKPQVLARELVARWQAYARGERVPALN